MTDGRFHYSEQFYFMDDISMNILEGLYFGSLIPFDEVNMDCPDYFKAGKEVERLKAKMLELHPDLKQLMEDLTNAQMEQAEFSRFHEFSVRFRAGAQLMLEMTKEL